MDGGSYGGTIGWVVGTTSQGSENADLQAGKQLQPHLLGSCEELWSKQRECSSSALKESVLRVLRGQ